jgi:hypothetical protein
MEGNFDESWTTKVMVALSEVRRRGLRKRRPIAHLL